MFIRKIDSLKYNVSDNTVNVSKKTINYNHSLHWHDFFEIELIMGGHGKHTLNGKSTDISASSVFLLTPNDFHEVECKEDMEIINIQFTETMVDEKTIRRISNPANRYEGCLNKKHYDELFFLAQALCVGETSDVEFKKNILNSIITIIIDNCESGTQKDNIYFYNNTIDKAKLYMTIYFRNNPSLNEIADYVGLNRSYFSRLFLKEAGQTPMAHLTEIKLLYAKKLIISTPLSITEIAFNSGFGSLSNFLKAFKSFYELSPTEMRTSFKQGKMHDPL